MFKRTVSKRRETGLSPPVNYFNWPFQRRCFFYGSFMLFLSCICYAFLCVCLFMPCGQLLGKGWPLGFRLWCLIVKLSLSNWYPGSGVVLDYIDSWFLPSFLLSWASMACWQSQTRKLTLNKTTRRNYPIHQLKHSLWALKRTVPPVRSPRAPTICFKS